MIICPSCGKHAISRLRLIASLFRFFSFNKCTLCKEPYTPGNAWQGNVIGALLLASVVSGSLSVSMKSYIPYLILLLTAGVIVLLAVFFMKPKKIKKLHIASIILDWVVLILVVAGVFYLITST